MPLPNPTSGDNRKEFVNKCMDDSKMIKEFPNDKQRAAVCHSQYDRAKKAKGSGDPKWGDSDDSVVIY